MVFNKAFLQYLFRFLLSFCILYYGTLAVIGLAAPGGYYSPFIHNYLNYVGWLRFALLSCSKLVLTILGYHIFINGLYTIMLYGGHGVHIVYSCIGYGIMSFWVAFIFANKGKWQKKIKWIAGGVALIFSINVVRISLLLIAINKQWSTPFNINHHTLFNIVAYVAIFILMYFFDRSQRSEPRLNHQLNKDT
jgi:exosortase/archaeosortase family protein